MKVMEQKKRARSIKKIIDSEIIESATAEKADSVANFNKLHKIKTKCKENNDKNVSDCKISEINIVNNTSIQIPIELNQHRKKNKHQSLDEMGNVSDYRIEESDNAKNNKILDGIHKRKRRCKQTEFDNKSQCLNADLNYVELSQNNMSNENFSGFNKQKGKKSLNSLKTAYMEFNYISKKTVNYEVIEKVSNENSDRQGNKLSRKNNKHYETKAKNHKDRKCKSVNHSNELDCEIVESATIEKSVNDVNSTVSKKSLVQTLCVDVPHKTKRKNKKYMKSRNEISNNLRRKKKSVGYIQSQKSYQQDAYMSFDPFIHDVIDVPVSFPVPLLHEGETVASVTPERKEYLEKNGIVIRNGRWTKTEDDILTRNFQQFGLKFGVNNPFQLLGINHSKRDEQFEKYKKAKHFLLHLGKDLNNRSLRSIYMRARKLLTPLKNKERLNLEETTDLKHAYELVGNKWTRISEMLSRTDNTCSIAFRWHKSNMKKGKWTPEEEEKLIEAIKIVTEAEDISADNLKSVPWKSVAEYVPTRNEYQCHKHWAEHLAWDTTVSEKKQWTRYHYGKLIYLLKEKYCFRSEIEIDWRKLHKHFKDVAPSYIFLHKKWFNVKGRLPKKIVLSYSKCLDAFKKMYKNEYKMCANEKL